MIFPEWLSSRAGFGLSTLTPAEFWAARLYAGWYVSWTVHERQASQLPRHWQMIRLQQDCFYPSEEYIRWNAARYPGNIWIIGNEPDVIWQDNLPAGEYAKLYGLLYKTIKAADPTARVAPAGISQSTPLRLAYLDLVLKEYQALHGSALPADLWTVHGFVLREQKDSWGTEIPPGMQETAGKLREVVDHGNLDLFKEQITSFRAWMNRNGYRNLPLALTEFGILMPAEYGFPKEFVTQYMADTFAWLQHAADPSTGYPGDSNKLVQNWAWFSLSDELYPAGNLANLPSGQLTDLGKAFSEIVLRNRP